MIDYKYMVGDSMNKIKKIINNNKAKSIILMIVGILAIIAIIFGVSYANDNGKNNAAKAGGSTTTHNLIINKEAEGNKQGNFTYRIKVWKEEVVYDFNSPTKVGEVYKEMSDQYYSWSGPLTTEGAHIYYNGKDVSEVPGEQNIGFLWVKNPSYPNEPFDGRHYGDQFSPSYGGVSSDGTCNTHPFTEEYLNGDLGMIPFLKTFVYYIDENLIPRNTSTYNMTEANVDITIDGVNYPMIVDGEGDECYHDYTLYIPKIENFNEYLNLSSILGTPVSENTYQFTLDTSEHKTISIPIPEGYKYEIEEVPQQNWELVSINGDTRKAKAEGTIGQNDQTVTFLNRDITPEVPDEPVSTDMSVVRKINNAPSKVTNEFTYSITPDGNNPASVTGIPSTFKITFNNESSSGGVAQKGKDIDFEEAVYTKPGDYKFVVEETASSDSSVYPKTNEKYEVYVSVRYKQQSGSPTKQLIVKSLVIQKTGSQNKTEGPMIFEEGTVLTYITISNTVEGNMADIEKYFKVKVNIEGETGETYTILGQDTTGVTYNGASVTPSTVYTVGQDNYIYLKHGQSVTIGKKAPTRGTGETSEIKSGIAYSFVEDNAGDSANYETYINESSTNSKNSGNLETDSDESKNINPILNVYNSDTMTGKFIKSAPYIAILLIAVLGIGFMVVRKIKHKEEE